MKKRQFSFFGRSLKIFYSSIYLSTLMIRNWSTTLLRERINLKKIRNKNVDLSSELFNIRYTNTASYRRSQIQNLIKIALHTKFNTGRLLVIKPEITLYKRGSHIYRFIGVITIKQIIYSHLFSSNTKMEEKYRT